VGVQYTNGGILVFADYVTNDGDKTDNSYGDLEAWKVGGKYTINNFSVYGQYEDITNDIGSGIGSFSLDETLWHLAGSYTMGNNMVYLGYGDASTDDLINGVPVGSETEQTAITLAGTHSLSKRTTLYAAYVMIEQDNDTAVNALLDGFAAPGEGLVNDPEADVFTIGMKHKF